MIMLVYLSFNVAHTRRAAAPQYAISYFSLEARTFGFPLKTAPSLLTL